MLTKRIKNCLNLCTLLLHMKSPQIRSSTLRLGIFIGTLILAVIIIFQLLWLRKVYRFEQKEFDHSVVKSIRGLYEDLSIPAYNSSPLNELVEKPEQHFYIARFTIPVNTDSLSAYLQYELEDFGIFTDCHLGLYKASTGKYIYTRLLRSAGAKEVHLLKLPVIKSSYDAVVLFFPNRNNYILTQMNFWITSSAILLIVLLLLSGSLYFFYKQKFLNETQKDFIHSFTHEFKTPVSVIGLAAEVLQKENIITKPEKLSTYAGIVAYQAAYLHHQTDRLLKFAYIDSHQLHLEKEPVNIHGLVQEAINNLSPLIQQKKAVFQYALDAVKPVIYADKGYLEIVIINIIDNALKYSKEPVIRISTTSEEQSLSLSVTDNGAGISKKELKHLFKKFYRAQKEDQHTARGFGIGLSFVKRIITAHKGKIQVQSRPGKGSTFTITLPEK